MHGGTTAEPPINSGLRLVRAVADELVRRVANRGPSPEWAEFETAHLLDIGRGALSVAAGLSDSVGSCPWDGYALLLTSDGWCCVNGHCVPRTDR